MLHILTSNTIPHSDTYRGARKSLSRQGRYRVLWPLYSFFIIALTKTLPFVILFLIFHVIGCMQYIFVLLFVLRLNWPKYCDGFA